MPSLLTRRFSLPKALVLAFVAGAVVWCLAFLVQGLGYLSAGPVPPAQRSSDAVRILALGALASLFASAALVWPALRPRPSWSRLPVLLVPPTVFAVAGLSVAGRWAFAPLPAAVTLGMLVCLIGAATYAVRSGRGAGWVGLAVAGTLAAGLWTHMVAGQGALAARIEEYRSSRIPVALVDGQSLTPPGWRLERSSGAEQSTFGNTAVVDMLRKGGGGTGRLTFTAQRMRTCQAGPGLMSGPCEEIGQTRYGPILAHRGDGIGPLPGIWVELPDGQWLWDGSIGEPGLPGQGGSVPEREVVGLLQRLQRVDPEQFVDALRREGW